MHDPNPQTIKIIEEFSEYLHEPAENSQSDSENFEENIPSTVVTNSPTTESSVTVDRTDVVTENTVTSHRKSVSFDLSDTEYKPVYDTFEKSRNIDADVFAPPPATRATDLTIKMHTHSANDGYEIPISQPVHQYSDKIHKKGILRSPNPSPATTLDRVVASSSHTDEHFNKNNEIERENPFRKEFFSEPEHVQLIETSEDSSVEQNVYEEIPHSSDPFLLKLKPVTSYGGDTQITAFLSNEKIHSDRQHRSKLPQKTVDINTVNSKQDQRPEMKKNTKIEFSPDAPLPPIPSPAIKDLRRTISLNRPTESPPPPPINFSTLPSADKLHYIESDSSIFEIIPAKFDMLPTTKRAEFYHENSPDNILVTEDTYRQIMLRENEMRNAIKCQQSDTTKSRIPVRQAPPPPPTPPLMQQQQQQEQYQQQPPVNLIRSVQQPVFISTNVPYHQQNSAITMLSPTQIFPQTQILPVQYSHLPMPQQPGYYRTFSPQPQIHLAYPSTSTGGGYTLSHPVPHSSYMVSDTTMFRAQIQQDVANTNDLNVPLMGHSLAFNQNLSAIPVTVDSTMSTAVFENVTNTQSINWNNNTLLNASDFEYRNQSHIAVVPAQNQMSTFLSNPSAQSEISPIRIPTSATQYSYPSPTTPTLLSFGKQSSV